MEDWSELAKIGPSDFHRMDWSDIANAIVDVMRRNGMPAPELGETNRSSQKKVLAAMLKFEEIVERNT